MRNERINLALYGAAKKPIPLWFDQPTRISRSLAHPRVKVAEMTSIQKPRLGEKFKLVTRPIGKMFKQDTVPTVKALNCAAFTAQYWPRNTTR